MNSFERKYQKTEESAADKFNRVYAESKYRREQSELRRAQQEQARMEREYARQQAEAQRQQAFMRKQEAQQQNVEEKKNKGGILGTVGYLGESAGLSALRRVEGVFDEVVGGIARAFGKDEFADKLMQNDWVNYNHANEWYNPSEFTALLGNVASGVGGMLPSVAVAAATGGAGTALGMGTLMTGAAGQAVSEAAKQSGKAGDKEWLYGTGSGFLEGAIEGISGGIGGALGKAGTVMGKQVAKSTAGKLATTFVGEGLEEVASDLIDPYWRRLSGVDKEAQIDWSQLPETFFVGGTAGAIMGGASRVHQARKAGGFKNLAAMETAQEMQKTQALGDELQAKGKLTEKWESALGKQKAEIAGQLSERMKSMTPESRAKLIADYNLDYLYNADGTIKSAPEAKVYNKEAVSYSLRDRIGRDADQGGLRYAPTESPLTDAQRQVIKTTEKMTKGRVKAVIADNIATKDGTAANGLYENGILYINKNANAPLVEAVHEITHSLEGTPSYAKFVDYVFSEVQSNPALAEKYGNYLERYLQTSRTYGEQTAAMSQDKAAYVVQTELAAQYAADMFGNEEYIQRLVKSDRNIAVRFWNWIKDKIKVLTAKGGDKETIAFLQKAERLYRKALGNSVGGVKLSELADGEEGTADGSEVDYADARTDLKESIQTLGEYTERQKKEIGANERETIAHSYEEIIEFIRSAKPGDPVKRLHIGTVGKALADKIQNDTGLELQGYDLVLDNSSVTHIFKKHGNANEIKRGQIPVTYENVETVIDTIIAPDSVMKEIRNGITALTFEKENEGKNVTITILSTKKGALTLKSAWITKRNSERTPPGDANAKPRTSETSDGIAISDKSISQESAFVNSIRKKTEKSDDGRFSIVNRDGKRIVVIDTDQDIFEGVPRSEYGKVAREYMKAHFRGETVEGVKFNSKSEGEYTKSKYTEQQKKQHPKIFDTKMRAVTELENLVKTSKFLRHEYAKHPHTYNVNGYNRYAVEFVLDGNSFSGEMLVALSDNGGAFYDIVKIKESGSTYEDVPKKVESTSSTKSIPQEHTPVNSIRKNSQNSDSGKNWYYIDNFTEKQYNGYGWARVNGVISGAEYQAFFKRMSDKKNGTRFPRSAEGRYIVAVGDRFGVNNVLIYTDGKYASPSIERVVRINFDNETDIDIIRRDIYEWESRDSAFARDAVARVYGETLVNQYAQDNYADYREYQREGGARSGGEEGGRIDEDYQGKQDGRGNSGSNQEDVRYSFESDRDRGKSEFTTNKNPTTNLVIRYSLANNENGKYNEEKGKQNGEGKIQTAGSLPGRNNGQDADLLQGGRFDSNASGRSVRGMAGIRRAEEPGTGADRQRADAVAEFVEHSKRIDKYTEELAREHARKLGYDVYFAKLISSSKNYFIDGKKLIVGYDLTANDFGRILDRLDPINRKTEHGKTAHISSSRWKAFLDIHGEEDVFVGKIPIQSFLDLTADRLVQRDIRDNTAPLDEGDLKRSGQLYLKVDFGQGVVLDHEGRHRLTALLNAGYQNADVFILAKNADKHQYDEVVLRPQFGAGEKKVALFYLVSATDPKYKDFAVFQYQIKKDDNVRYSLDGVMNPDEPSTKTTRKTEVLTEVPQEEQTRRERAKGLWANFQVHFSDEQAGIVKAGKRLGIEDIEAKTHYARAAYNAAGSMLDEYQANRNGEKVGEGFRKIWDPIYAKGDGYRKAFYEYLLHHQNIDRLAQGKEVFADTSREDSKTAIAALEAKHPEFKAFGRKVWKYNDNLLSLRVDMGLISAEAAKTLREMYPHYVPTYRDTDGEQGIGGLGGKYNLAVKTTIKTAKGSTLDILPPDVIIARQTMEAMRAGRVNELIASLYDAAVKSNDFTDVSVAERKKQKAKTKDAEELYELLNKDDSKRDWKQNQVTFYRDGEQITLNVTPDIFAGLEAYAPNKAYRDSVIEAIAKGNSAFKKLVTSANPFFLVRNFFRDLQEALFYTKHGTRRFISALGKAYKQIATNGEIWQRYKALGGLSSGLFDYNAGVKRSTGLKAKAEAAIGKLEWANMLIEQAPRLTEFMLSLENGASAEQALLDSADVTTNFSRGGKTAKMLNRTVMPFLNPSIQGWSKLMRTVFGKKDARAWLMLIMKALVLGVGVTALNDLLNGDDEEYASLSLRDKENYYLFKIGDTFLKIPKGRVLSVFGSLYLRAKEASRGNENAWEGYLSSVLGQVSPVDNITRTIFSPITDAATNTTWYGGEIEGRKFENMAPEDRYDESTSSIAIALGKLFKYSPKKIHYVIDQYSGIIGDIVLPLTTKRAERGVVRSNFTIDPVLSNRWSNDFYAALDEANYAKAKGDVSAAYLVRYLNSVAGEVSDMYAQKQQIEASDKPSKDKSAESKAIQIVINETQKKAVEGLKTLKKELAELDPVGAARTLSESKVYSELDERAQGKAYQRLNDYYYALALNRAFGTEMTEKHQLYSLFDSSVFAYLAWISEISGDTDRNGNMISGSRKKKVFAYINGLPLSAAQKYVLMGLAGYKNEKGEYQVKNLISSSVRERNTVEKLLTASGY